MVSKSAAYDESRDPLTKRNYLYVVFQAEEMFRQAQHDEQIIERDVLTGST